MYCHVFSYSKSALWVSTVILSFSQGSVSTLFRWGGYIFFYLCVKRFLLLTAMQKLFKSSAFFQSCDVTCTPTIFFGSQCTVYATHRPIRCGLIIFYRYWPQGIIRVKIRENVSFVLLLCLRKGRILTVQRLSGGQHRTGSEVWCPPVTCLWLCRASSLSEVLATCLRPAPLKDDWNSQSEPSHRLIVIVLTVRKTALDRSRTDRICLTHHLDLCWAWHSISCELWWWPTHRQKFKVNDQSVLNIEWKQTDGRTDRRTEGRGRLHYLPRQIGR